MLCLVGMYATASLLAQDRWATSSSSLMNSHAGHEIQPPLPIIYAAKAQQYADTHPSTTADAYMHSVHFTRTSEGMYTWHTQARGHTCTHMHTRDVAACL